jgi:flagellar biogenesis protein FliO
VAYLGPKRAVYVIDAAGEIIVVGSDGSGLRLLTKLEGKKAEDLYRMIEQNKTVGFRGAMTKEVNAFVASGVSESRQGPDEREKLKNSIKDIHSQIEKLKRMKGEI